MRKLLLVSVAALALSSAAQAANTSTTVQIGAVINSASTTQNGLMNDTSSTTQVGLVNGATTLQGTSGISLNNASTVNQIGIQNTAVTGQAAVFNNGSKITQNSFGPLVLQNNSASTGQLSLLGLINTSTVSQTAH
jgi:major curlin subunit